MSTPKEPVTPVGLTVEIALELYGAYRTTEGAIYAVPKSGTKATRSPVPVLGRRVPARISQATHDRFGFKPSNKALVAAVRALEIAAHYAPPRLVKGRSRNGSTEEVSS